MHPSNDTFVTHATTWYSCLLTRSSHCSNALNLSNASNSIENGYNASSVQKLSIKQSSLIVFRSPFGEHVLFSCTPMTAANLRNTDGLSCLGDALELALENKHTNYSWIILSWTHLFHVLKQQKLLALENGGKNSVNTQLWTTFIFDHKGNFKAETYCTDSRREMSFPWFNKCHCATCSIDTSSHFSILLLLVF